MGETGFSTFHHGSLDPQAQEFVPTTRPNYDNACNFVASATTTPQLLLSPQIFYPLPPPPPPQTLPFSTAILSYHHYPSPYLRALPSLPPESSSSTRTLTLSSVSCDVTETLIRRELEVFGDVRRVEMERICDGIVTVHFYDLRHAESALKEIRNQHMQHQALLRNIYTGHQHSPPPLLPLPPTSLGLVAGCAVWAQFAIPSCTGLPEGQNQGTIVVFNLDPTVSTSLLAQIFRKYGAVKEVRETPMKKQQRFVEFYDVRDAAKALREMNGKEIGGKEVVIEFSRPGGYGRKFFNANACSAYSTSNHNSPDNTKIYKLETIQPSPMPRRFCSNNGSVQPSSSMKRSPSKEKDAIEVCVRSLSLEVDVGQKKNLKTKSQSTKSNTSGVKQPQKVKPWKNKQAKKLDTRFLINEETMLESNYTTDSRTTVMIKNIPNKYSQKLLLNMLDNHCIHCNEQISEGDDQSLSSYDFVYLPIDFNNKCNVGYGFVNMTSPQAAWRLYKAFHHQHWEVFNSRKICQVTYARVQGLEALKEHFKNSKFPCEMDHYLPVIFSPPRDGRQQTEPVPIVGNKPVLFDLPSTDDAEKIDGENGFGNIKEHDSTEQEQEEREAMVNCSSSSCSHSQNGGDLGCDDDKD